MRFVLRDFVLVLPFIWAGGILDLMCVGQPLLWTVVSDEFQRVGSSSTAELFHIQYAAHETELMFGSSFIW